MREIATQTSMEEETMSRRLEELLQRVKRLEMAWESEDDDADATDNNEDKHNLTLDEQLEIEYFNSLSAEELHFILTQRDGEFEEECKDEDEVLVDDYNDGMDDVQERGSTPEELAMPCIPSTAIRTSRILVWWARL